MPASDFEVGRLIASLGLDTTQFMAGMKTAQGEMAAANAQMKTATATISAQLARVSKSMVAVGKNMNKYLTLPLLAVGAGAVKMFSDFEASMSKIEGLVGVAGDSVAEMTDQVLELAKTAGRGPEELADALFFVTSAGLRGAEAMNVLTMATRASVSGLGETKVIADLVTSAMNAYGAENLNASMATDILTAAVREGKAEATDLAGAMGVVLPIASEMGVSFDQVGAAFAGMTRTGTNAAIAATQLKAIMSSLLKPTEQAEDALMEMGLSSSGLRKMIKEDGLIATLELLRKTTNQYGEEAMAKVFPNIRALMGVLDLMGANMESNIAITESLANATGSADRAYEAATKTVQFQWNQAVSASKVAMVELGGILKEAVLPALRGVTEVAGKVATWFDAMTDAQKRTVIQVVALTAAMGPLLTILGKLGRVIAKNPYVVLATVIIAATVAVVGFVKANKELFGTYDAVRNASKKVTREFTQQSIEVKSLVAQIENENTSNDARIAAIEKLKRIIPEYNGYLTEEGELIGHNTGAIENYLKALREKIKAQIFEEQYTEAVREQVRAQDKLTDAYADQALGIKGAGARVIRWEKQLENAKEGVEALDQQIQALNITIASTPDTIVNPPGGGGGNDDDGGGGTPAFYPDINTVQDAADDQMAIWDGLVVDELGLYRDMQEQVSSGFSNMFSNIQEQETEYLKRTGEVMAEATDGKLGKLLELVGGFEQLNKVSQLAAKAIAGIGTVLGNVISGTKSGFKGLVSVIIDSVQQILNALLAEAIAGVIAKEASTKGLIGLATGVVGVGILGVLWKNLIPDFATGGVVYGETLARVGEYPGARSNPEVIAPLSDLKGILGNDYGPGQTRKIKLTLEGRDATALIDLNRLLYNTY